MLEKPDLADDRLGSCLGDAYGLPIVSIDFLPLGADRHTAVYRVTTDSGAAYFLKLRLDAFNASSVCEQIFLSTAGDSDREQALRYLVSKFAPHSVLDIAYRADERLSP